MSFNIGDFLKGLLHNAAIKALIRASLDHEIYVLWAHNPPDQLESKVAAWLSAHPFLKGEFEIIGEAVLIAELHTILQDKDTIKGREDFKVWLHARLGLN